MSEAQGQQSSGGTVGTAQEAANTLVDSAQTVASTVYDVAEEAVDSVFQALLTANRLVGEALEACREKLTGQHSQ